MASCCYVGIKSGYHEIIPKLCDAVLHYALGNFEEAIRLLKEVISVAPNLFDPHHSLGRIYAVMGDKKRAIHYYMIAAHLHPHEAILWKLLITLSIEEGNTRLAKYCLSKAMIADRKNIGLWFSRSSL